MSAVAHLDKESKKLIIKATLVFYGKYAEPVLAQRIINEITTLWNEPKTLVFIAPDNYEVDFNIDFEISSNNDIVSKSLNNQDFALNFIRIEDTNVAERSMMGFGLGENAGHWLITDSLGDSTTAAHEFGHALGLPHPDQFDYRNTGSPPMMAPRGTIVDSEYQWNPMADAGTFGGTMRPIFRKVRPSEIKEITKSIIFTDTEAYAIGKLTNLLFDEIGRPVTLLI